jgi:hypothetical protein
MYKLVNSILDGSLNCIQRISDGALIPIATDNTDYQQYLAWVAQGNTPTPADEPTA